MTMSATLPDTADILLVEDQPSDAELARRALYDIGLSGRLALTRRGTHALDYVFARGRYAHRSIKDVPRLVLLDLKLPRLSGAEVLEQLKADPRTQPIPVVILSSSQEAVDIRRCYALGANSYVVKPVDYVDFTKAVQRLGRYWLQLNEPFSPNA